MILGAGAVRAWTKWRSDEIGETRWSLIGHSAFVLVLSGAPLLFNFIGSIDDLAMRGWRPILLYNATGFYFDFPLQVALLMLLLGLFMRSPRT